MTFKEAKRKLSKSGIGLTKQDGEYRVVYQKASGMPAYVMGEGGAYYTDDLDDAINTGIAMSKYKPTKPNPYGQSSSRYGPNAIKFYLKKVPLNQGGYDRRGRYYGTGAPLWRYSDVETGDIEGEFRASSKAEAKEILTEIASKYR